MQEKNLRGDYWVSIIPHDDSGDHIETVRYGKNGNFIFHVAVIIRESGHSVEHVQPIMNAEDVVMAHQERKRALERSQTNNVGQ